MPVRKYRPSGDTGKDEGEGDAEFTTVEVPPVSEVGEKLAQALKQQPKPCRAGCWCDACLYRGCEGHADLILTEAEYLSGVRRNVKGEGEK
jgi:hypothetical protein